MAKKYYSLVTEGNSADLFIFGDITSWEWLESDVSSYTLAKEVQELNVDNINVHINSYGGEVAEALAIYNTLKRHRANVTTYVDGFACSAATIVFMAGDDRIMSKIGNFLVHPAWSFAYGNADELRKEADNLDAITEQSITAYLEHITKSREELVDLMSEEKFLTPDEVLEWGFASEIEEEDEAEHPAASVRGMVHKMLMEESNKEKEDLDALHETIDALEGTVLALSEKIDEDEDEKAESESENEADPAESEEETDTDTEKAAEEETEKPQNKEAAYMECFLTALNSTKGEKENG